MVDNNMLKSGDINEKYTMEKTLGKGSFGEVKKARNKDTNEEVAIKIIAKENLGDEDLMALQVEVEILSNVDHPNIVKLKEVWEDDDFFYMVMELMTGGELFDRIVEKDHYSEKEASDTIRPVIDAIRYCHKMGVVHRDLKPENLLYATKDQSSVIKISDFGLAKVTTEQNLMQTQCGTPSYVAPEVLKEVGYNESVDLWSIGIIIYVMLCGFPPFYDDDEEEMFKLITAAKLEFPSPYWDDISSLAKDLITGLLHADSKKRLTAEQALQHPWIVGDVTSRKSLGSNRTDKMKSYLELKKKMQKAKNLIVAAHKFATKAEAFAKAKK